MTKDIKSILKTTKKAKKKKDIYVSYNKLSGSGGSKATPDLGVRKGGVMYKQMTGTAKKTADGSNYGRWAMSGAIPKHGIYNPKKKY